jgi:cytochrome c nitrite reductase small subunit
MVGVAFRVIAGIGGFTFIYARGYSYLTNDPAACANCHVMREQFDGWVKSSHRAVAGCNDCHTPPGFAGKYYTKARNGFWHSFYFTNGGFHADQEAVRILGESINFACLGQLSLRGGVPPQPAGPPPAPVATPTH